MPNWCDCNMVIYTDDEAKKENIKKVYELLDKQLKRAEEIKQENEKLPEEKRHTLNWDTYEIYKTLEPSITKEAILSGNLGFIRGNIFDIQLDEKKNAIHVGYETAWEPMIEGWNYLLKQYGLKQVTIGEEMGCDVYVNTDTEGRFFPERYIVSMCIDDEYYTEYYETTDEVLEDMNRYFDKKFVTIAALEKFFDRIRDDNDDNYVVFEEYSPE